MNVSNTPYVGLPCNILLEDEEKENSKLENRKEAESSRLEEVAHTAPLEENSNPPEKIIPREEAGQMEDISKNLSIPLDIGPDIRWLKDHPSEHVIGNVHEREK